MVLTSVDIKVIAIEIASQIITELRKPVEKSFGENESTGVRQATYKDKDALVSSFKDHERRRTHKEIENKRTKD